MNLVLTILGAVAIAILLAIVIVKYIPLKLRGLVSIVLLAASGYLAYLIYQGIMEPINFNKDKIARYVKVIDNLKLIRDAEVKYKQVHGEYTNSKDSLIEFVKNGQLAITEISNREEEVDKGGGIKIKVSVKQVDTTGYEPVLKYFSGRDFENMFSVPGTDKQFDLATSKIEKLPGLMVSVFEAKVSKKPILKGLSSSLVKQELEAIETDQVKGEFVSVGSLLEVTTAGNWPPSYDKAENLEKKD